MGKPYSLDLRERICGYVAEGNSARSAGRLFGVSAATAVRLAAEHREHGTAVPKPQGRPAGQFGKLAPHRDFLLEIVQAEPDITLKELAAALSETYGVDVQLAKAMTSVTGRISMNGVPRATARVAKGKRSIGAKVETVVQPRWMNVPPSPQITCAFGNNAACFR